MDIQQEAFAPAAHAACLDDVGAVSAIDFGLPRAERARADEFDELLRVHEYERQRMGQDLHDSAGQLIVCLQLSVARLQQEDAGHEPLIREIQDIVGEISHQVRSLAFMQYPAELADRGLASAMKSLVSGFDRRTGTRTAFVAAGEVGEVDDPSALALLRVTQEALVNVYRHAHASTARVSLKRREDSIELSISDNGIGLPEIVGKCVGIGLQGMRHRIEVLGGCFRTTNLKHGMKIYASIPIAA